MSMRENLPEGATEQLTKPSAFIFLFESQEERSHLFNPLAAIALVVKRKHPSSTSFQMPKNKFFLQDFT
jgi:hypothetical protein